ncbi:serine/threonine protein kinase [Actinokineospora spheciospongiae]|uniref:non-specific serine/threonine protein kinase n=1 Tax=Actinokineospora spheciospongiae TaxID=909613 RepID=W7J0Z1_9PSEU|nr:serine/threonine-protein kinase [Actinokineospora spheciospongiae]EWC62561.1 serine/threonine protein kinase [Actinokineospora spheciospongiae]
MPQSRPLSPPSAPNSPAPGPGGHHPAPAPNRPGPPNPAESTDPQPRPSERGRHGRRNPIEPPPPRPEHPGRPRPKQPGQPHSAHPAQPGQFHPAQPGQSGAAQSGQPRPGQAGRPHPAQPSQSNPAQPWSAQPNAPHPDRFRPAQPAPPGPTFHDDFRGHDQPTSVLEIPTLTQSIEPPPPVEEPEPTPTPDPSGSQPSTGSGSFPGTGRRTASRAAGRGRLGAGLVEVPVVPVKDPASAVLDDPVVAENKRFCNSCGAEVGRGGPPEGVCGTCGQAYNFRPRLFRGDLVGGQYEVLGSIAYGGLGWIYLAKDHNVSARWVVLKGLIDTGDATSMASVVAERRFLAEVEHPNVVKIYNFVQHPDPNTGSLVGYIVMEYVGGQSLRQLALEHHRETGRAEPLPIGQVIAYGLEILPAIGYLHSIDMLYCDLKPDNVIQTGEQLKLIDLGAVRKTDDYESPLFFTAGYAAPELATEGATVASDIYTVGRTLAVLSIEFAGYTTRYRHTLPGPDAEPLFALFGSYHRVLKRATHADPLRRFTSAGEMADQLTGVLREVMALGTGRPRPGLSTVFSVDTRSFGASVAGEGADVLPAPAPAEVASVLPLPLVDTDDHAATVLASITATEPAELVAALNSAPRDSIEVRLRLVKARMEQGDLRAAHSELVAARRLATDPAEWRPDWFDGLVALVSGNPAAARDAFDRVYDAVPGELAPKLALAASHEQSGDHFAAARFYELVWRTDHSVVSAAFGLARVYLAQGARGSAIEVLDQVPDTSSHHLSAQIAAIKIKARAGEPDGQAHVTEPELHDAAKRLERLTLDAERRTRLAADVLEAAHGWVGAGKPGADPANHHRTVLGCALSERELRFGLEHCYRTLARLAGTPEQRHALVDQANSIRPRTIT